MLHARGHRPDHIHSLNDVSYNCLDKELPLPHPNLSHNNNNNNDIVYLDMTSYCPHLPHNTNINNNNNDIGYPDNDLSLPLNPCPTYVQEGLSSSTAHLLYAD